MTGDTRTNDPEPYIKFCSLEYQGGKMSVERVQYQSMIEKDSLLSVVLSIRVSCFPRRLPILP